LADRSDRQERRPRSSFLFLENTAIRLPRQAHPIPADPQMTNGLDVEHSEILNGARMTSESRVFIEPDDLLGVEFECLHCLSRFLYKLPDKPIRIISHCPNCNEAFYGPTGMEDFQQFFALLTAMPRLADKTKLKVRLQVKNTQSHEGENEKIRRNAI